MRKVVLTLVFTACAVISVSATVFAQNYNRGYSHLWPIEIAAQVVVGITIAPTIMILESPDRTFYIGADGGYGLIDFERGGYKWQLNGENITLRLGLLSRETTNWRMEVSFTYGEYSGDSDDDIYSIEHTQYLVLFHYYYDIKIGSFSISPTIGAGWRRHIFDAAGYNIDQHGTNDFYHQKSKGAFAAKGGLSLRYVFGEHHSIDLTAYVFGWQEILGKNLTVGYSYIF